MPPAKTTSTPTLPGEALKLLKGFRRRRLLLTLARGCAFWAGTTALFLIPALLLDRFLLLETPQRSSISWTTLSASGASMLFFLVLPLLRPWSLLRCAAAIEKAQPALEGSLLSIVELCQEKKPGCSGELLDSLRVDTAGRCPRVRINRILPAQPATRALAGAIIFCLPLLAATAWDPPGMLQLGKRLLNPRQQELPRPSTTFFLASADRNIVGRGQEVTITVSLERGTPGELVLLTREESPEETASWKETSIEQEAGSPAGDRPAALAHKLKALSSFTFRVRGGDFMSPAQKVEVRSPPTPRTFSITYHYPEYTARKDRTVQKSSGNISALRNSRADIVLEADRELARAAILLGAKRIPGRVDGQQATFADLAINEDGEYRIELETPDGIRSREGEPYSIRILEDNPPRIAILSPRERELEVESSGTLQLRYRAEDDYGISSVELMLQTPREARVLPVFREINVRKKPGLRDAAYAFSIGATGARPPETLSLRLRVRDGLGGESLSAERKLKVTWPGDAPEGPGWLPSLQALNRNLKELAALWSKPVTRDHGDETAENLVVIRTLCLELSRLCLETAIRPPLPAASRFALESVAFRLRALADEEVSQLWQQATGPLAEPAGTSRPGEGGPHQDGLEKIETLSLLLESLAISEELEEAHETLRVAAHDCRLLGAEAASSSPTAIPGRSAERLGGLIEEVISCAAGIDRLRKNLGPLRAELKEELEGSVRAMSSSLTAELELARKAAEKENPAELESPLQRAADSFSRRVDSLSDLHLAALKEYRQARRWQVPESEFAGLLEGVNAAWKTGSSRRELLTAARGVFTRVAWRNETGQNYEYSDFESASLLGAVSELLERVLEEDASRDAPGRGEKGTLLVDGLARASLDLEPALWLGRSLQLVQWIAAGEEAVAWRLEGLEKFHARRLGLARRAQADIGDCLGDLLLRLRSNKGVAARFPQEQMAPVLEVLSEALTRARNNLEHLRGETADPAAAALGVQRCASLLEEATGKLEEMRRQSLAELADSARWLRSNRGTINQRLDRLAESLRGHGKTLKDSATVDSIEGKSGGELIVEALVTWTENVRQARKLAREIRQGADQQAESGSSPAMVVNLERASTALLALVAGPLGRCGADLRRALTSDRDDRELLLSSASAAVFEAAAGIQKISEALDILDSRELAELSGKELEELVTAATNLAEAGSMDLSLIEMRARLLLDAALQASRELRRRLPGLRARADLLDHLEAAAERFSSALKKAMAGDAPGALARLGEGITRMEQAIALAKNARGEARGQLESNSPQTQTASKPEASEELSKELESARRELEKLLEIEKLRKEASSLLERLLAEEENPQEQVEAAQQAQESLAQGIEERVPSTSVIIELVSRLATLQKLGRETASQARYLEEEARQALAASDNGDAVALAAKLAGEQEKLEKKILGLVDGFSRAGFKLSMLLPSVFKAYRKAAASTDPLGNSITRAGRELAEGKLESTVDSLAETNLQLGVFLADLDQVRARAIETLAEAEAGGRSAYSSLQSAMKNARQAAKLIAGGKINDARRKNASARSQLLLAGRAIRRQLENIVLPGGEEGPLVSGLLEAEAARLGLVWQTGTRGEEFEANREDETRGLEDMDFPPAYRDLVRIYLRAIRN